MDLQLKGKRALVLASSRGLGFAIAKALAAEGVDLCISSRGGEQLEQAAKQIHEETKAKVVWEPFDLRAPEAAPEFISRVAQKLGGPVEILVHNTGGPKIGPTHTLTLEDWREGFTMAFLSAVAMTQAVVPGMKEAGFGRILTVASLAAIQPLPGFVQSSALRSAVVAYFKTLSSEVAAAGITVNTLLPGMLGDGGKSSDDKAHSEARARAVAMIPTGRIGKPEEFAALAAFLSSPHASYITGANFSVDGGMKKAVH
ncbi:SDR family oxidoreductase [Hyalangium versicolor]|uniref:SDR family oxidoreductase n=1 Tax=Hyalangium versicolor TaxID=2861190 RepID=UPI001CCE2F3A|nr:SDR family oxidoreductase [Hyalangium versicolor]